MAKNDPEIDALIEEAESNAGPRKLMTKAEGYAEAIEEAPWWQRAAHHAGHGLGGAISRGTWGAVPRDVLREYGTSDEDRAAMAEGEEIAANSSLGAKIISGAAAGPPTILSFGSGGGLGRIAAIAAGQAAVTPEMQAHVHGDKLAEPAFEEGGESLGEDVMEFGKRAGLGGAIAAGGVAAGGALGKFAGEKLAPRLGERGGKIAGEAISGNVTQAGLSAAGQDWTQGDFAQNLANVGVETLANAPLNTGTAFAGKAAARSIVKDGAAEAPPETPSEGPDSAMPPAEAPDPAPPADPAMAESDAIRQAEDAKAEAEAAKIQQNEIRRQQGMIAAGQREAMAQQTRGAKARARVETAMTSGQEPSPATQARLRNAIASLAGLRPDANVHQTVHDTYGTLAKQFRTRSEEVARAGGSTAERVTRQVLSDAAAKRADALVRMGEDTSKLISEVEALGNPSFMSAFLGQRTAMLVPSGQSVPIAATETRRGMPKDKDLGRFGMFKTELPHFGSLYVNAEAARELVEGQPRIASIAARLKADVGTKKGFDAVMSEAMRAPDVNNTALVSDLLGYGEGAKLEKYSDATHIARGLRGDQEITTVLTKDPGESEYLLRTRHGVDRVEILDATPENVAKVYEQRVGRIADPREKAYWQAQIAAFGVGQQREVGTTEKGATEFLRRNTQADMVTDRAREEVDSARLALAADDPVEVDWVEHGKQVERLAAENAALRGFLPEIEARDNAEAAFQQERLDQRDAEVAALRSDVAEAAKRPRKGKHGKADAEPAERAVPGQHAPEAAAMIAEAAQNGRVPKAVMTRIKKSADKAFLEDADTLARKDNESIDEHVARLERVRDSAEEVASQHQRAAAKAASDSEVRAANTTASLFETLAAAANKRLAENRLPPGADGTILMHSGIPIHEGLQREVEAIGRKAVKALGRALTDRAEGRKIIEADILDRSQAKLAEWFERRALKGNPTFWRKTAELLNLPSPHSWMRNLTPERQKLFDETRQITSKFEFELLKLKPEDRTEFWRAADSGDKDRTIPAHHGLLDLYHQTMRKYAQAMVDAGTLSADAATALRGRYVERVPTKGALAEIRRLSKADTRPTADMESRIAAKLSKHVASSMRTSRVGEDALGIGFMADAVDSTVKSRTSKRYDLSTEEAESIGYLKGVAPILKGLRDEGAIYSTFKFIEKVKGAPEARQYWKTAEEAAREGIVDATGEADPNWILADSAGFGALRGHYLHASIHGQLSAAVPEARSGWLRLMQVWGRTVREDMTVLKGPGFQVASLLDNTFHAVAAGANPLSLPKRLSQFHRAMADYYRSGTLDETLKDILDMGLFREGHNLAMARDETGADPTMGSEAAVDFRDVKGARGEYVANFFRKAGEKWDALSQQRGLAKRRGARAMLPWAVADVRDLWHESWAGLDFGKAFGLKFGKDTGWTRRASLSGNGLRDLTSVLDLGYKYATYRDLRENGGSGLTQRALSALLARKAPRGMNRDEATKVMRDWFDIRAQPTIIRRVSNLPFGFAYIRFPLMQAWNLFGRGYALDNPVGAALLIKSAQMVSGVGAWAARNVFGMTEDEIEETKLLGANGNRDKADEQAIMGIGEGPNGMPVVNVLDFGRLEFVDFLKETVNPASRVEPSHGEGALARTVRGVASSDPFSRMLYEGVTGNRTRDAEKRERPLSLSEIIAGSLPSGLPLGRTISNAVSGAGLDREMIERGEEPYGSTTERVTHAVTGLPLHQVGRPGTPRGETQRSRTAKKGLRREEQENEDLEFMEILKKPKPPAGDDEDAWDEYFRKLEAYVEADAKRKITR